MSGLPPNTPRARDRVAVVAFLLLFWIPMLLRSTVLERPVPGTPALLTKLHEIACLFTHKPSGWSSYYVQVQQGELPVWRTLDQSELFPLEPFGRRTRMHRLLAAWQAKPGPRTEDMARWIVLRWTELHPEDPALVAIRFTRTFMVPSRDEPPQRGWEHPDFYEVPPARRRVIASYRVDELFAEGSP
ncbi:MAG: hypothetical protein R6X02_05690 [Enhygromyxa sp.]